MVRTIDRLIQESHRRQLANREVNYINSYLRSNRHNIRNFWSSRMYPQWLPGRRGMRVMVPPSRAIQRRRRLRRR